MIPLTADELAQLLAHAKPFAVELTPAYAFNLIGQLQLALRHPQNNGLPAEMARETIDTLRRALPLETQLVIEMGFRPEFDGYLPSYDPAEEPIGAAP